MNFSLFLVLSLLLLLSSTILSVEARPSWKQYAVALGTGVVVGPPLGASFTCFLLYKLGYIPQTLSNDTSAHDSSFFVPPRFLSSVEVPSVTTDFSVTPSPTTPFAPQVSVPRVDYDELPSWMFPTVTVTETELVAASTVLLPAATVIQTVPAAVSTVAFSWLDNEAIDEFICGPWYAALLLVLTSAGWCIYQGYFSRAIRLLRQSFVSRMVSCIISSIWMWVLANTSLGRSLRCFFLSLFLADEKREALKSYNSDLQKKRAIVKARRSKQSLMKRMRKASLSRRSSNRVVLEKHLSEIKDQSDRLRQLETQVLSQPRVLSLYLRPCLAETVPVDPVVRLLATAESQLSSPRTDESFCEPVPRGWTEQLTARQRRFLADVNYGPVRDVDIESTHSELVLADSETPLPPSSAIGDSQDDPVGDIQPAQETESAAEDDGPVFGHGEASNDALWKQFRDSSSGDESDNDGDEDSDDDSNDDSDEDSAAAIRCVDYKTHLPAASSLSTTDLDDDSDFVRAFSRLFQQVTVEQPFVVQTPLLNPAPEVAMNQAPSTPILSFPVLCMTPEMDVSGTPAAETTEEGNVVDEEMSESLIEPAAPAMADTAFTMDDLPLLQEDEPSWLYTPVASVNPFWFESDPYEEDMEASGLATAEQPDFSEIQTVVEDDSHVNAFALSDYYDIDADMPLQAYSTSLDGLGIDMAEVSGSSFFIQEEEQLAASVAPESPSMLGPLAYGDVMPPALMYMPASANPLFPRTQPAAAPSVTSQVTDILTSTEQPVDRPLPEDRPESSRDVLGKRRYTDAVDVVSNQDDNDSISSGFDEEREDAEREERYLRHVLLAAIAQDSDEYDSADSDDSVNFIAGSEPESSVVLEPEQPESPVQTRKLAPAKSQLRRAARCKLQAGDSDLSGKPPGPPPPPPAGSSSQPPPPSSSPPSALESASVEGRAPSQGAGSSTTDSRKSAVPSGSAPCADSDDDSELERELELALEAESIPSWREIFNALETFDVFQDFDSSDPQTIIIDGLVQRDPDWVVRFPWWLKTVGRQNNYLKDGRNENFRVEHGRDLLNSMQQLTESRQKANRADALGQAGSATSTRVVHRTTGPLGYMKPVSLDDGDDSEDELEQLVSADEDGPPDWQDLNTAISNFRVLEEYGATNRPCQGDPDWVARHPYWLKQNRAWYLAGNKNQTFLLTYGRQAINTMKRLTEKARKADLERRKARIQKQKELLNQSGD